MKRVIVGLLMVLWVGWGEAKDCHSLADCGCGDTLVTNTVFGAVYKFNCPNVDQALKVADGVYLDCSGTTVVGNGVGGGSAGFRLGYGSVAVGCKVEGFQYGFSVESWYATIYACTVLSATDEGVHFHPGTQHNTVNWSAISAPNEAIYLYGSHYNEVMNSVLTGNNAVYAKGGASNNYIHNNSLNGGVNRINQVGAGSQNYYYDNDAHGGTLRSSGSVKYSGIHNNHQGDVSNVDGALWPY